MKQLYGEDFVSFLDENPLMSSIEVRLFADYANTDGMAQVENLIKDHKEVKKVFYQKNMVNLIHENIRKISAVLLAFAALMLIVAITLINNTVRLMVYSKRFLIRTMQLVGATKNFIRRPFIGRSMLQPHKTMANNNKAEFSFALQKENYKLLAIGLIIIIAGFLLMAGGGTDDPNIFDERIYSFRRITLAPMIVLAGYIFEIYAIMKKPADKKDSDKQ